MERLMAYLSHFVLEYGNAPEVLPSDMKSDKKDLEEVQRVRIPQATCTIVSQENFSYQTGGETTKRVNIEIKFKHRPNYKRDAA
jgi:hypothetical protein